MNKEKFQWLALGLLVLCVIDLGVMTAQQKMQLAQVSRSLKSVTSNLKDLSSKQASQVSNTSAQAVEVAAVPDTTLTDLTLVKERVSKIFPKYQYVFAKDYDGKPELRITSEPGELFISSGGPGGPKLGEFLEGFEINIFNVPNDIITWGTPKKTPYSWVTQWPDQCEAGCWGGIYTARMNKVDYYITIDSSHGFDTAQVDKITDEVFRAFKPTT
jgi:hypothetical protein